MLRCSNVVKVRFPPKDRNYPQVRPCSVRAGLFFLLYRVKGAEMGSLEAFFIFWSVAIIALLTLLGIDVIRIWMLDRWLSTRSRLPLSKL
jgi:hypothetical protein